MKSKIKIFGAILAAILIAAVGRPFVYSASPEPGSGKGADAFCLDILAKNNHKEARQWLKEATKNELRTIGEHGNSGSRKIVEQLYQLGAVTVEAVKIHKEPGYGQTTNILVLRLPEDPAKRKKLFSYEAKIASGEGFDPTSDDGQKYMFLYKFKLSFCSTILSLIGLDI